MEDFAGNKLAQTGTHSKNRSSKIMFKELKKYERTRHPPSSVFYPLKTRPLMLTQMSPSTSVAFTPKKNSANNTNAFGSTFRGGFEPGSSHITSRGATACITDMDNKFQEAYIKVNRRRLDFSRQ